MKTFRTRKVLLANDGSLYDKEHDGSTETLENSLPESALLINEVHIDDRGWAVIPFGDWPHEMGMQKFQREQAEEIATGFNNLAGRFRRAVVGLPIFKGHPDHPVAAIANQYPDKEEKGQIAAVEVRSNGLALKLILSNAGAELVRKGWKFISPMWIGNLISKAGEAFRTYAPTELRSVGLVVKPNIPSPSLANAASAANQNKTMNPETLKLLGLAADASPEAIATAVKALKDREGALANDAALLVTTKGELTALQGKVAVLENAATADKTTITETRTTLANERKARIGDHVAAAIRTGRCTEAEKPTWTSRLEANFEAESAVLANAAPKVKTASEIPAMLKVLETQMRASLENAAAGGADDGDEDDGKDACGMGNSDYAKMKPEDKSSKMKAIINEHMGKLAHTPDSVRYNSAFANAKKANPRLFGFKAKDVQ